MSPSALKVWRDSFLKKALYGGINLSGQIYGGLFYMGTNDQIMQGGGKVSQMHFPVI